MKSRPKDDETIILQFLVCFQTSGASRAGREGGGRGQEEARLTPKPSLTALVRKVS